MLHEEYLRRLPVGYHLLLFKFIIFSSSKTLSPIFKKSKETCLKDYLIIFSCEKLLPPMTTVSLDLTRSSDDIFIEKFEPPTTGGNPDLETYKVLLDEIECYIPVANLNAELSEALVLKWKKELMLYNYKRWIVQRFVVQKSNSSSR